MFCGLTLAYTVSEKPFLDRLFFPGYNGKPYIMVCWWLMDVAKHHLFL